MLFNSSEFVLFFPTVAGLYFLLPHRFQWVLLLAASYFFYMCWEPGYLTLILISTLVDYFAGIMMGRSTSQTARRGYLILSICMNLGLLAFFKYYNFFAESIECLLVAMGFDTSLPVSKFLLPVGISFYTFQTLSYTIEVYRGNFEPQRHLGIFALYVAFFPQLVAGPIERAPRLLPQFLIRHDFDYVRVTSGVKLMFWGLFKKVVIADRLAMLVDPVYSNPHHHDGFTLAVATVFFAFQIYCDFSGYSDIAIGGAQVFGIKLMDNFNRPYGARSVAEFWRRWHISLSTWFRDYLYIPLGGNRITRTRWNVNIAVVFLLSGLWHGANWTFVIWGLLHAGYMIVSFATQPLRARLAALTRLDRRPALHNALQVAVTFALVCFAWIFFRAETLGDATHIAKTVFADWRVPVSGAQLKQAATSIDMQYDLFLKSLVLSVVWLVLLLSVQWAQRREPIRDRLARHHVVVRFVVYSLGLWAMFLFGVFQQKEFIYFTF